VEKNYIPTFDNGATSTQLRWLASYYPYADAALQQQLLSALARGVAFVLAAQYPNGGFAQTYPLRGGYHDAMTLNDGVMETLLRLLQDVALSPTFAMLPQDLKTQAASQFQLGLQLLLRCQLRLNGELTVWAAQYHPVELTAVAARAYEWPALVSSESAGITGLLMEQPPTPAIIQSVEAAVRWFERQQIRDQALLRDAQGVRLQTSPGAKPLWARFYDLAQQQPLFVDRDGQRYARLSQLSLERQLGYGWYQSQAATVLKAYPAWRQRWQGKSG
jgi:PelA/Pel-15E family pectate lyase